MHKYDRDPNELNFGLNYEYYWDKLFLPIIQLSSLQRSYQGLSEEVEVQSIQVFIGLRVLSN